MNNDIKPKITYKDHFLPTFLTDLIIKDSSMRVINIEEEKSELYYKTLNGYGKIERGEVDISIKRLYQLADILQLTVIDFFDEKDCLIKLLSNNCQDADRCQPTEGKEGKIGFDSQMYIEFLEQRIAWLKAQLASQTANEVES